MASQSSRSVWLKYTWTDSAIVGYRIGSLLSMGRCPGPPGHMALHKKDGQRSDQWVPPPLWDIFDKIVKMYFRVGWEGFPVPHKCQEGRASQDRYSEPFFEYHQEGHHKGGIGQTLPQKNLGCREDSRTHRSSPPCSYLCQRYPRCSSAEGRDEADLGRTEEPHFLHSRPSQCSTVHKYWTLGERRCKTTIPVFRCARGSTSLESFHLHLARSVKKGMS